MPGVFGHSCPLRHNGRPLRCFRVEVSTLPRDHAHCLPAPPPVGADAGCALFLDVDGTLLDFAAHPDDVAVDAHLREDLARLRTRFQGALALLSGRPLAQLDGLFAWQGHAAAGLHGAELRSPDGREHFLGDASAFATARARAAAMTAVVRDVLLEDKRRALALHYRRVPIARAAAERIAQALLADLDGDYALQRGDHVIELKPAGADKGRALAALMRAPPFSGRQPWMLGDDLTDEDAFGHVNAHAGISVVIGPRRPTAARYALRDPATVRAWLHALAARPHGESGSG